MIHNPVGQVQAVCVFDQSPARLASRSIPSEDDVILKVGDNPGGSITGLGGDGLEEEVHGVYKSLLGSWRAFGYETSPVTTWGIRWSNSLINRPDTNLFVNFPTLVLGSYVSG